MTRDNRKNPEYHVVAAIGKLGTDKNCPAKHKIHGLAYQPRYQERAYEHDEVDIVLLRLYNQYKTKERTVVASKGGHVEKDLLNKLNIPCLDLETWGCPEYEQLKQTIVEPLASCGFHLNDN